jgi:hypothetical protein
MIDVLVPFAFLLLVGGGFLAVLQSRTPHAAIGIGSMYAGVVIIYASYPLLMYLALKGYYTPFNDQRLFADQPPPADIGHIAWFYGIYLASFAAGYLLSSRRALHSGVVSIVDLDPPAVWALFVAFIALRLTMIVAEFSFAEKTNDYIESYLKYKHLPLLAQQLLGHVEGMTAVLGLTVMAYLCRRWKQYRLLVAAWLALELSLLIVGMGARTQFVLLCLAALFSYHFLYRPVTTMRLVATGMALVVAFLGLGILRSFGSAGVTAVGIEAVGSTSEFEALFGNAYEIDRLIARGDIDRGTMAGAVYVGDVVNLVPQQLVPFEKLNLANWYVTTFHSEYAERGGAFAFGAVPEALIGTGWPDLIWRGLLVGFVFARFDRTVQAERVRLWKFALFLWLITSCYMTFRSTTLALLPVFVYRFVPALLSVAVLAYLLRAAAIVAPNKGEAAAAQARLPRRA